MASASAALGLRRSSTELRCLEERPETHSRSEKFEVKLHEGTFKGHRIDPPSLDVHVSKNQLVEMYTQMTCVSIASRAWLTVAGRCAGWRWRPTSSTSRR